MGYRPGLVGALTRLHAVYYHRDWGLDHTFEAQVAYELGQFILRHDPRRDLILSAWRGDDLAGAVVVDHDAGEPGARLRWFIVDPAVHGSGLGGDLLGRAMSLTLESNPGRVYLYTFQGLEAARVLYLRAGFSLAGQRAERKWGSEIIEQLYETRPAGPPPGAARPWTHKER